MTTLTMAVGQVLVVGLIVSGLVFAIGGTLNNQRLVQIATLTVMAIATVGWVILAAIIGFHLDGHVRNPIGFFMLVMSPICSVISLFAAWRLVYRSDNRVARSESRWLLVFNLVISVSFALVGYWALQPA